MKTEKRAYAVVGPDWVVNVFCEDFAPGDQVEIRPRVAPGEEWKSLQGYTLPELLSEAAAMESTISGDLWLAAEHFRRRWSVDTTPAAPEGQEAPRRYGRCVGHLGPPGNTNEPHLQGSTCFSWKPEPPAGQEVPSGKPPMVVCKRLGHGTQTHALIVPAQGEPSGCVEPSRITDRCMKCETLWVRDGEGGLCIVGENRTADCDGCILHMVPVADPRPALSEEAHPGSVTCPVCGAEPGIPCGGMPLAARQSNASHSERYIAAKGSTLPEEVVCDHFPRGKHRRNFLCINPRPAHPPSPVLGEKGVLVSRDMLARVVAALGCETCSAEHKGNLEIPVGPFDAEGTPASYELEDCPDCGDVNSDREKLRAEVQAIAAEPVAAAPVDPVGGEPRATPATPAEPEKLDEVDARVAQLERAIRWALGEAQDDLGRDFAQCVPNDHKPRAYWWRAHLRALSAPRSAPSAGPSTGKVD